VQARATTNGAYRQVTSDHADGRAWTRCAFCTSRQKGLCRGVESADAEGSAALESLHSPVRVYDVGEVVYAQGDASTHVFNLISGWVGLHRDMPDGRRQISQFLTPGALFGVEPLGEELGHAAVAITSAVVCPMPRAKLDDLRRRIPSLNERFIWLLEHENHRAVENLTTIGQGSAKERIAHLLAELAATAGAGDVSALAGAVMHVPLTQRHIAEATGLTSIHVNRVLRQLREDLIVDFHAGTLTITNPRKLQALAETGRPWAARAAPGGRLPRERQADAASQPPA
jgi:CRP-like cAMP-binding protein